VIQGQLFGGDLGVAVVAAPPGNAILPPLAFTQFARGFALFAQLFFGDIDENIHAGIMAQAGMKIQGVCICGIIFYWIFCSQVLETT
jgi:hypothetical protein